MWHDSSDTKLRPTGTEAPTGSSGTLVPMISGMISWNSSYTWIQIIWIHRSWNVTYEFMIMKYYIIHNMNSDMNSDMNSWSWRILWNHVRIHMYEFIHEFMLEFMIMKSHMNSNYEFMNEFSAMKNLVILWLKSYKWIHIWKSWLNSLILNLAGFILKSVQVSVRPGGEFFTSEVIMTPSLHLTHCLP